MYLIYGLNAREYLVQPRDRDACQGDKWTEDVEDAVQFATAREAATFLAHNDVPGPVTIHKRVEKQTIEYTFEEVA